MLEVGAFKVKYVHLRLTGLFYHAIEAHSTLNALLRVDKNLTLLGEESYVGQKRSQNAGASLLEYFFIYGGLSPMMNRLSMMNSDGVLVNPDTFVGTARYAITGSGFSDRALFYGGQIHNFGATPKRTLVNWTGVEVVEESNISMGYTQSTSVIPDTLAFFLGWV